MARISDPDVLLVIAAARVLMDYREKPVWTGGTIEARNLEIGAWYNARWRSWEALRVALSALDKESPPVTAG